jgi:hypothetical protein
MKVYFPLPGCFYLIPAKNQQLEAHQAAKHSSLESANGLV